MHSIQAFIPRTLLTIYFILQMLRLSHVESFETKWLSKISETNSHRDLKSDIQDVSDLKDPRHYRPHLKDIFWLHIEKTSSWIDNLLAVWACPDAAKMIFSYNNITVENDELPYRFNYWSEFDIYIQKEFGIGGEGEDVSMLTKSFHLNCSANFLTFGSGFGYHMPYHDRNMKGKIVSMFRKPIDRIISAFLFSLMLPQGSPYTKSDALMEQIRQEILSSKTPVYTYSQTLGMSSCQTKMVLGHNCGTDYNVTEKDLTEAKRRIREEFYFFGLTEDPVASANLFLAMHHNDGADFNRTDIFRREKDIPLFDFRTGRVNNLHDPETHEKLAEVLSKAGWSDYYDDELYKEAKKIFEERCAEYNVTLGLKDIVMKSERIFLPNDFEDLPDPAHYRKDYPIIFWLHIEKTSSWIDNLLAVWACPHAASKVLLSNAIELENHQLPHNFNYWSEFNTYLQRDLNLGGEDTEVNMVTKSYYLNCSANFVTYGTGFGYHMPYHEKAMNHTVVTMFRKPVDRVISAYLFEIMLPQGSPYRRSDDLQAEIRAQIMNSSSPVVAYAQLNGIPSCQTKMLLGHTCGSDIQLHEADLIEAKRRINEDLYFFGLTEEPLASANLFLAMHHDQGANPNRTNVFDKSFNPPFNFRTGRVNSKHSHNNHEKLLSELNEAGWSDRFDEELYKEASRVFYDRCRKYNVALTHQKHLRGQGPHYQSLNENYVRGRT